MPVSSAVSVASRRIEIVAVLRGGGSTHDGAFLRHASLLALPSILAKQSRTVCRAPSVVLRRKIARAFPWAASRWADRRNSLAW